MTENLTLSTSLDDLDSQILGQFRTKSDLAYVLASSNKTLRDVVKKTAESHLRDIVDMVSNGEFTEGLSYVKIVELIKKSEVFSVDFIDFFEAYIDAEFDQRSRERIGGEFNVFDAFDLYADSDSIPSNIEYIPIHLLVKLLIAEFEDQYLSIKTSNIESEEILLENLRKIKREVENYENGLLDIVLQKTISDPIFKGIELDKIISELEFGYESAFSDSFSKILIMAIDRRISKK